MKKNTLKAIALILTALCALLTLTACSGKSTASTKAEPKEASVVGTWKLVGVYNEVGQRMISPEGNGSELTLVMNSDETYTLTGTWMGMPENSSGSYTYMSDRYTASIEGRRSWSETKGSGVLGSVFSTSMKTFSLDGDTLYVQLFGVQQVYQR